MSNTAKRMDPAPGQPTRVAPYVPATEDEEAATRAERYDALVRELDALRDAPDDELDALEPIPRAQFREPKL